MSKWQHSSGDGMWADYVNERGDHTLREHTLRQVGQYCNPEKHIYDQDIPSNRTIVCTKCGQERKIVVGFHKIVDGLLKYASRA